MTWPNLHTQVRDEAAGSSHGQSQVVRHCLLELRAEPLSRSTHLGVGPHSEEHGFLQEWCHVWSVTPAVNRRLVEL